MGYSNEYLSDFTMKQQEETECKTLYYLSAAIKYGRKEIKDMWQVILIIIQRRFHKIWQLTLYYHSADINYRSKN